MNPDKNTVATDVAEDPVVAQIRSSLLGEAERVSSANTGVEDTISAAIGKVTDAQKATAGATNIAFDRAASEGARSAQSTLTGFSENRSGFATNMAGLRNIVHETDVYMKDLEGRRQEALLMNDAKAADTISGLMLKGQEMKMNAMQQTFNNLLSINSMGIEQRRFEQSQAQSASQFGQTFNENKRQFALNYTFEGKKFQLQKDQQSQQEKQAIAGIALEYGLNVDPTDTIDSIVTRAAGTGYVNDKRKLELESLRSDIARSNAQMAEANRGNQVAKMDDLTKEMFAQQLLEGNPTILDYVKDPADYSAILAKTNEKKIQGQSTAESLIKEMASQGKSVEEITNAIKNSPTKMYGIDEAGVAYLTDKYKREANVQKTTKRNEQKQQSVDELMINIGAFRNTGVQA